MTDPIEVDTMDPQMDTIRVGINTLNDSRDSLHRTLQTIHATRTVGIETTDKINAQTEQLKQIDNNLNEIQETTQRSTNIIRRIGRKIMTDKYIVCLSFLLLVAIITAIVLTNRKI
jgi:NADH:ubiquinone oxidoreductase subunit 6 (subunit J)